MPTSRRKPFGNGAALKKRIAELQAELDVARQIGKALSLNEKRLRAIIEHSPAVIFVKDCRGRYLDINPQFERLFGLSRRVVLGRTDTEIFPRAQAAAFRANDREVFRSGMALEFEECARYVDGAHVSVVMKFPLRRPNGKIYGLCGIATDITPRKVAEQALRLSEERFRLLIADVRNYAIFLVEPDGRVASWNAGAGRLFGYGRDEIVGRNYERFFVPEDIQAGKPVRDLKRALKQDRLEEECWRVRKDGTRFLANVITTPIRNEAGELLGFARVLRDLTETREVEDALRQGEEHYRRLFNEAQAMQENLRSLSNKILHVQEEERRRMSRELHDEVGQSLTAISVMLATLNNSGAGNGQISQKIATAQRLIEETTETIHRFARELRPALLDELGLLPALRSHIKNFSERTGLAVHLHAKPVAETLDSETKTALFRVTQESLTNIAKHARASRVDIDLRKSGGNILLRIADNGRSFPAEGRKPGGREQRLGLLGMQERVRLVNGKFSIQSSPAHGTTVQVTVPLRTT
ncbi:MAG TPA: PAS domain S-box protein [Verrucomicrobiae bacterium]|jgi:PAS domain S-box-containing protein